MSTAYFGKTEKDKTKYQFIIMKNHLIDPIKNVSITFSVWYVCASEGVFVAGRGKTVFLDVEGAGDALSSVGPGGDGVATLGGLRAHGVGEVQDAAHRRAVQPLGDAVSVGVLGARGVETCSSSLLCCTFLTDATEY